MIDRQNHRDVLSEAAGKMHFGAMFASVNDDHKLGIARWNGLLLRRDDGGWCDSFQGNHAVLTAVKPHV